MKKKSIYLIVLLLFIAAVGFVVVKYKAEERNRKATAYTLQERSGGLAQASEWTVLKERGIKLQAAIRKDPSDIKSKLALASLFIQEARITGNHMYYDMAAMHYVNEVLEKESANFEALSFKAILYISQHHFAEGVAIAEQAVKINPYNAYIYGILVDGNIEMGNYEAAVMHSDKMVSIRPDLTSYSRISYLREIHGDYPGAIEAMEMAVDAGPPGDESTEWSRAQLAHLFENTGDLQRARMHYLICLQERPGYAHALAGLARLSVNAKEYAKAVEYYRQADSLITDYGLKEGLAEAYRLSGEKQKADALARTVIEGMSRDSEAGQADEKIGHYSDRELANAHINMKNYDKALEHALLEYNRRPQNIDVNETLAWVYYCMGDYEKALPYMKTALRTNSANPSLLCRAGLIYSKAGDKTKARSLLQSAFKNNPNIAASLKSKSLATLHSL